MTTTKKYQVRVSLVLNYDYELRAKDWRTARAQAEKLAEREFENGNTDYDMTSEASEIWQRKTKNSRRS